MMQVPTQVLIARFSRAAGSRKGRSPRSAHCDRQLYGKLAIIRHNHLQAKKGVNKVHPRRHISSITGYDKRKLYEARHADDF